jgi:ligand-binding SRPBCC domain-containing protein
MSADTWIDRLAWAPSAGARPARGIGHLHREVIVPTPLDVTFAFFTNAANLERLTPPWLSFRIRSPLPIEMRAGALIDYRITLHGWPIPWQTHIDVWEPGVRFVDRQIRGPYRWWHHEHRFEAVPGGTNVIDHVEYLPRARWLSGSMVQRDVARIFEYRQSMLPRLLTA